MRFARKIAVLIAVMIAFSTSVESDAFELGPFDVTIDLCKNVQLISSVVNAWSQAAFPVTGQPGFAVMIVQRTSPLLDLCDFVIQLKTADTTEAIFLTADKLNQITEEKWDDYLKLTKKTYQLANSVYDFNSGQKREGTLDAVQLAQDVGEFQRMVTDLGTGNNPQAVKQRQNYDQEVAELANVAHQRAILKEGTTCPEPAANTPDYYDIVDKQITPKQKIVQTTENDLNFLRYQLIDMGPRFLHDLDSIRKYHDDVQNLMALGVSYKITEKAKQSKTVKPTGKSLEDGTAEKKTENVQQTVQNFDVLTNAQMFTDFRSKYESKYAEWASAYWKEHSETEGGRQTLQTVFRPAVLECVESKLMRGYESLQGDEYERVKIERYKQCESANKMDQKRAGGLMATYIVNMRETLYQNKKAQGEIWSLESQYLGRKRSVSMDKAGNYFQESVVCEKSPEMIDLELIQAKQQEVNASYNEIIARETVKGAMIRDEEIRRQNQLAEDTRQKQRQIDKDNSTQKQLISTPVAPNLDGSL
jgi:hypothetical protein